MKLLDILNERVEIPKEERINSASLKQYIFEDWQIFNQKLVPSFKYLRSKVVKESYSPRTAKNNLMNVVEFAAKKYTAENTNRKHNWNQLFPLNERYELVSELVQFFETHNLDENYQLLTEQDGQTREASITFSQVELEVANNQAFLVLNFKYDDSTTNFVINALSRNQSLKLSDQDSQLIKGIVTFNLTDSSSGQKLSYLKYNIDSKSILRSDLKHLISINNRRVILEVITQETVVEPAPAEQPQPEVEQPQQQAPEQIAEPINQAAQNVSDKELKEIVNQSIKELLGA